MNVHNKSNLMDLPSDILNQIPKHISDPRDLSRFSMVSQTIQKAVQPYFDEIWKKGCSWEGMENSLHSMVRMGNQQAVKKLLINPIFSNINVGASLVTAVENNRLDIVKMLVEKLNGLTIWNEISNGSEDIRHQEKIKLLSDVYLALDRSIEINHTEATKELLTCVPCDISKKQGKDLIFFLATQHLKAHVLEYILKDEEFNPSFGSFLGVQQSLESYLGQVLNNNYIAQDPQMIKIIRILLTNSTLVDRIRLESGYKTQFIDRIKRFLEIYN
ncbi:MAG: hypothetical protein K0S74_1686 [Chlamydiales bacterium]|jgi:hypothetical protein|nr:hypothetical protein [Chlamydiales bacterium]